MHWFPFYCADFLGATIGLSHAERGAFALMLITYYELRQPYPLDRVRTYRTLGCESDEQKRVVDYLLTEFFIEREDGWYQAKAEQVLAEMDSRAEQARNRGVLSAEARKEKYGTAQPKAFRKPFDSVSKASGKAPELATATAIAINSKTTTLAPDDSSNRPTPASKKRIQCDITTGKFHGIQDSDMMLWQEAYPAISIPDEVDRAGIWLRANPSNRKSNYERFLVSWFTRSQDRAGRVKA